MKGLDEYLLFENDYYRVEHCRSCPIPGYLIVTSKEGIQKFSDFDFVRSSQMGLVIGASAAAVEKVVRPENIYVLRFGEESRTIHFHIFPRTTDLTKRFRDTVKTNGIAGPQYFEWARAYYVREIGNSAEHILTTTLKQLANELKTTLTSST